MLAVSDHALDGVAGQVGRLLFVGGTVGDAVHPNRIESHGHGLTIQRRRRELQGSARGHRELVRRCFHIQPGEQGDIVHQFGVLPLGDRMVQRGQQRLRFQQQRNGLFGMFQVEGLVRLRQQTAHLGGARERCPK